MPHILEEKAIAVKEEKVSFLPQLRALSKQLTELESDMAVFWKLNPAMLLIVKGNKIQRMNPAWKTQLGYEYENVKNKGILDLVHPEDRKKLFLAVNMIKNKGEMQNAIVRCKHLQKEDWIYVKLSLSYVSESDSLFCTAWPLLSKCKDCPFN